MATQAKELVKEMLASNYLTDTEVLSQYMHPELVVHWNSSDGYVQLRYSDLSDRCKAMGAQYEYIRHDLSHLLVDGDMVTARYRMYMNPVETDSDEELPIATMISIYRIEEDRIVEVWQVSQQADDAPENLQTYLSINK